MNTDGMNVIIFGSNGMLGRYVKEVFQQEWKKNKDLNINIVMSTRKDYDIEKNDYQTLKGYLDSIIEAFPKASRTYIINCAGAIPQKCDIKTQARTFIKMNTLFPLDLQRYCEETALSLQNMVDLIHITTDCVFSGKDGHYNEDSPHDETNIYGVTKSLGEPEGAYVLRTSIIGEEIYSKKSLLEWVIASSNNPSINGYKNHYWNGVTCLTLARIVLDITLNLREGTEMVPRGVTHIHSPDVASKYDLCQYIDEIYNLKIQQINPFETEKDVDKTLATKRENNFKINSIKDQIQELWNYHNL
jgi:dTDP-4-dehydrorhamnose reductase